MALIEAVAPGMRERGFGRVVNIASTSIREPIPNLMLSNVERSGIVSAFKTLARQLAGDGVTFNTVLPGWIDTERLASLLGSREAAQQVARDQVPAGRLGEVEEIAAVVTFLCSVPAAYVTGEAVRVDGARTAAV
jgi:3-oxoacyl-[acyl-carrier protein] reductase